MPSGTALETVFANPIVVTYTFTKPDPWDTRLVPDVGAQDEFPSFAVKTEAKREKLFGRWETNADSYNTITTVMNDKGVLIASLLWRDTFPDTVIYRNEPMSMNNWMSRSLIDSR